MKVEQAIKNRTSVRGYKAELVPEDKLNKVLEAARLAPSAHNSQNWKFIIVRDIQKKEQLAEAARSQFFIAQAPIVIAAVALSPEEMMSCRVPAYAVDLAIAVDHMTLQAAALGLGTCWIGAFDQEQVKQILNVPAQYKIVALLPLGYPTDQASDHPAPKTRKALNEIICYDQFK